MVPGVRSELRKKALGFSLAPGAWNNRTSALHLRNIVPFTEPKALEMDLGTRLAALKWFFYCNCAAVIPVRPLL